MSEERTEQLIPFFLSFPFRNHCPRTIGRQVGPVGCRLSISPIFLFRSRQRRSAAAERKQKRQIGQEDRAAPRHQHGNGTIIYNAYIMFETRISHWLVVVHSALLLSRTDGWMSVADRLMHSAYDVRIAELDTRATYFGRGAVRLLPPPTSNGWSESVVVCCDCPLCRPFRPPSPLFRSSAQSITARRQIVPLTPTTPSQSIGLLLLRVGASGHVLLVMFLPCAFVHFCLHKRNRRTCIDERRG